MGKRLVFLDPIPFVDKEIDDPALHGAADGAGLQRHDGGHERLPGGDFKVTGAKRTVKEMTYFSESLNAQRKYYILLPPGYHSNTQLRYPVVYLLHGIGMNPKDFVFPFQLVAGQMGSGSIQKMIFVAPDGRCRDLGPKGEKCKNWGTFFANTKGYHNNGPKFQDDFLKDLMPHIDATYRTKKEKVVELPAE